MDSYPNKVVSTTTEIDWEEGEYVRILSTLFGDDTDATILNMEYIEKRDLELTNKLRQLQDELKDITSDSRFKGYEEDITLAKHQFQKLAWEAMEEREEGINRR